MKKLLIIANLAHASPRIPGIASHMHTFDWEVTLLTPPLQKDAAALWAFPKNFFKNVRIIEVPYRGDVLWWVRTLAVFFGMKKEVGGLTEKIKHELHITGGHSWVDRFLMSYQTIFGYPDTEKYWYKPALKKARKVWPKENFDAIFSSSPYPTNHMVASRLAKEYYVPWIADFRDLWSQNHGYAYWKIRQKLDTYLEKKTLKNADAIIVVVEGNKQTMEALHQKPVYLIRNGFDPELRNDPPRQLNKKFTIAYTGNIYVQNQDVGRVLRAVAELQDEKKIDATDVALNFFGPRYNWLDAEIKKLHLEAIAQQHASLPREEAIREQWAAHLLLLLGWEGVEGTKVIPSKVFEYFAALRPILATGGSEHDEVKRLVTQLQAGTIAVDTASLKRAISAYYEEYKKTGTVLYHGSAERAYDLSYPGMADQLAHILNKFAAARQIQPAA